MRYIPHTEDDIKEMLTTAKVKTVDELFDSIPKELHVRGTLNLPESLSEPELVRHIKDLGSKNKPATTCLSFLGAGSYNHHVPAAVSEISSRSEWVTPYTPYQPEISQGNLQAIFEYQTMICSLTSMEVANASHYDGATATAEAALMAIQKTGKDTILVASTLHPEYKDTIRTILRPKKKNLIEVPFNNDGRLNIDVLKSTVNEKPAGLIVQSPNFFGIIEDLELVSKTLQDSGLLFIVTVPEPISLGMLKAPGDLGADIVTAEGQAFGAGLNFGGPYLGIFATRDKYLRAMPGRVVGQTTDKDGRRGFVLTMATREQHIRREKATSNICSNEAHVALRATIFLSLLGKNGLKELAELNLANAEYLKLKLTRIKGIELVFSAPTFNEFVIRINKDTSSFCAALAQKNIYAGVPLECWFPALKDHLLICTTECHNENDLDKFVDAVKKELEND